MKRICEVCLNDNNCCWSFVVVERRNRNRKEAKTRKNVLKISEGREQDVKCPFFNNKLNK